MRSAETDLFLSFARILRCILTSKFSSSLSVLAEEVSITNCLFYMFSGLCTTLLTFSFPMMMLRRSNVDSRLSTFACVPCREELRSLVLLFLLDGSDLTSDGKVKVLSAILVFRCAPVALLLLLLLS